MSLLPALCLLFLGACKEKTQPTAGGTYKTIEVLLSDATVSSRYSASIRGKQTVEIRPQISGLITDIRIDEGATVKKGQPLFVIDQVPYQVALETAVANVASAQARIASAQLAAESKQELFRENVISEYELQTARNSLLEAQAALAQAKASEVNARNSLSYTVVKSPVDGVAGMTFYRVGALVNSSISEPLVTVSNEEEMYAYFSMTENQLLSMIKEGGTISGVVASLPPVMLSLSNGMAYSTEGRIDAVSGTVDTRTGTISMRASFANPQKLLRNGSTATIVIPFVRKNCVVIPKSATFEIQNKVYVYKVVDGKAVSAPIIPFRIDNGTEYIVDSGLDVGDVIVAEGAGLLREGTPIQSAENN
ncbi:MAG: efflux RND transporter periplasmic adaptor subunit [Tannerellaceae bacterium]|nr:efflux RND transporter periplasmic adaptor subunit [Tannerellaceae bacterium]